MIIYRKKFLSIAEYWAGEVAAPTGVDLIRRFQQPTPLDGWLCRDFFTILIDLTRSEDEIFTAIKRGTRYEIRHALTKDDHLTCEFPVTQDEAVAQFANYFDEFAAQKSQPRVNRAWLKLLAEAGVLQLTRVSDATAVLVWHAYHCANHRATLLHSASLIRSADNSARRNFIGRANRLLHWQDMLHFKKGSFTTYDFGGWYEGTTNQQRLSINQFKEEFGGTIVKNYICERAITWKAKLFLRARKLLLGNAI